MTLFFNPTASLKPEGEGKAQTNATKQGPTKAEFRVYYLFNFIVGVLCTVNFLLFWAVHIVMQGVAWKQLGMRHICRPIYNLIDLSPTCRAFAAKYIYRKQIYTDFFAISMFFIFSFVVSLGVVTYWQVTYGYLPWWLLFTYYSFWVGFGGRGMGAAYSFAHREAHDRYLYKKWILNYIGNPFENWIGPFFGNIPNNFSTSHIKIHHRLQAGKGDTFYQWDLDRTSWHDFMLYQTRILVHMLGYSSLRYFGAEERFHKQYSQLLSGSVKYYLLYPAVILLVTASPSFLFWIYVQPLFCMTYFLAFINFGFHGWIEFDENGKSIECVNSTAIIDGEDDYFGEDDHMAHHYFTNIFWRDLPKHQETQKKIWIKHHASVFRETSILELSLYLLLKDWNYLYEHYVDYSGEMTKEEIMEMLETRAKRKEMTYEEYVASIW
eukprot:CAMPEP_0174268062 /NCGR_PEP_ID=MMETSP0439-20130205/36035_1 /TAXON_ID=0 /ORGANISM="Stereomyxa ramosa, Strain Chinc5" /LENGTH=435 /DNA_ID=CAMNT_0015355997 /DNA_START=108 /DNA_END=1412 /DNA_ORIENTATION=-